jgi:hypothetical protein
MRTLTRFATALVEVHLKTGQPAMTGFVWWRVDIDVG